jgi:hypothetical protein
MSSLTGSFQSCGNGNHSTSFKCSGTSCAAIQQIPRLTCTNDTTGSMTCSNGIQCPALSNLSSSFSIQGNGLNIVQAHNITVNGHNFTFQANSANFTNNTASVHQSAAYPSPKPGFKFPILIAFLLFSTQAFAQSNPSPELATALNEWDTVLGSLLDPLQQLVCELVQQEPTDNFWEQTLIELSVTEICLEELMITFLGLVGTLIDAEANATAYGSPLPITDPATLFVAAAGDAILCMEIALALFNDPSGASAAQLCGTSVPPATATAIATATATVSAATSTATSNALPPSWPPTSFFSAEGSCLSCLVSPYLYTNLVQGDCTTLQDPNRPPNSHVGLNITNPPITSWELSQWLCSSPWRAIGLQATCDAMCANPCETWSILAIIESMGSSYEPKSVPNCVYGNPALCNEYPEWNQTESYCGKAGASNSCQCGTGMLICYPLNPSTGECYS